MESKELKNLLNAAELRNPQGFSANRERYLAEISFKAGYEQGGLDSYATDFAEGKRTGIKEVVEWGLETCPHDLFGEGTQCYKRACDKCWQEKWGNLAP